MGARNTVAGTFGDDYLIPLCVFLSLLFMDGLNLVQVFF